MKTFRHCLAVSFALALAAGCASAARTATPSTSPTTTTPKVVTKTVTYADKGATVTLHVGDRLKVVLDSTYWAILGGSPTVLLVGKQVATPSVNGCVPGGGCGTVSETFTADGKGTSTVSASRTSCGEALRCTGGKGEFDVTVVVK